MHSGELGRRGAACCIAALCAAACLVGIVALFAVDAARGVIGQGAYAAATATEWPAGIDESEPGL